MAKKDKSLKEIEDEIKKQQEILEAKKKELENSGIKDIIESKIITRRIWQVQHYLDGKSVLFVPSGKTDEWPELARKLPASSWWITIDLCEGAKLHRFNDSIHLSLDAKNIIPLIKELGIKINKGNLPEQLEYAKRGIKFEQDRLKVLTALNKISL